MVTLQPYGKDQLPIPKNSPLRAIPCAFIGLYFFIPFIAFPFIGDSLSDSGLGALFIIGFFGWFFGLFGVLWLGNFVVRTFMRSMVGEITLEASSFTIQRGEQLHVRLHPPGNTNRTLDGVTIQLVKHEWVQYSCGTDTCTDTHDEIIHQRDFKPKQGADYEATFDVPTDAMHTFNANSNRVQWFVTIRLDIPTWPDYVQRYEVRCLAVGWDGK